MVRKENQREALPHFEGPLILHTHSGVLVAWIGPKDTKTQRQRYADTNDTETTHNGQRAFHVKPPRAIRWIRSVSIFASPLSRSTWRLVRRLPVFHQALV